MNVEQKLNYIELCKEEDLSMNECMELMKSFCQDESAEVRMWVSEKLGVFSNSEYIENILLDMVNDKDYLVRATVCEALSNSSSLNVLKTLMKLAKDEHFLVRGYAVLSIAEVQLKISKNEAEIMCFLKRLLKDEKRTWVKIAICRSMILLGDNSYETSFMEGVYSRDYRHRCFTLNLLAELLERKKMSFTETLKTILEKKYDVEKSRVVMDNLEYILNQYKEEA